ncbi:hypothetical protein V2J09_007787 [Rumex salicifolius]
MVEYGGQPPGDPPDASKSWAERVASGGEGGMPVPEMVLDDEFVASRMEIGFPNGEDGEPEITIGQDVLEVMAGLWKQCMLVKVLGRKVNLPSLDRRLRELWKPRGGMFVVDLPRQFFMVRFEDEQDYFAALTGGPWKIFGSYLLVQAWTLEFDPSCDDIVTTPVWVRLSNIPMIFYHRTILMGIASSLGKPVRVDLTTLRFERARFARVCVEVNLTKPLKGTILVNGERFFVSYEGLNTICSSCGIYGHLPANCPRKKTSEEPRGTSTENPTNVENNDGSSERTGGRGQGTVAPEPEGFTRVRNPARKGISQNIPGKGKQIVGGDPNHIKASNRFASLAENHGDSNKEIEDMEDEIIEAKDSGKAIDKNRQLGPLAGVGISLGPSIGPVSVFRADESRKVKPKIRKVNLPRRDLIFGTVGVRNEEVQIGKRLRTEGTGAAQNSSLQDVTYEISLKGTDRNRMQKYPSITETMEIHDKIDRSDPLPIEDRTMGHC